MFFASLSMSWRMHQSLTSKAGHFPQLVTQANKEVKTTIAKLCYNFSPEQRVTCFQLAIKGAKLFVLCFFPVAQPAID